MIGVDTNILVRLLVRDDEQQAGRVYQLFKTAEAENGVFFVPLLVVLELIWVLASAYDISRNDILDAIRDLMRMSILKFEHPSALQQFLLNAPGNNVDLSDLLIAYSARASGCEHTLTLDQKASRSELFELVT